MRICPGTYPEQVEVAKPLTLEGVAAGTANQAIVVSPVAGIAANTTSLSNGNPIAAQIWVHDATAVTIQNVTVDGSNNNLAGCSPNLVGVYYQDASGTINQVVTRNQIIVGGGACQTGLGIFVQSGTSTVTNTAGTSTVTISNNSVHDFQKNGITGNEIGTTVTVSDNAVRGLGTTSTTAENGIQLGFGATGTIATNTVMDEIWAPDTSADRGDAAAGILLYDAANTTIAGNHVGNTQFGIAVIGDGLFSADNSTLSKNVLAGTLIFDGIDLCGSSNDTVNNKIAGSTQSGIHLDGTCAPVASGGSTVTGNSINEGCAGVLQGSSGNTIGVTNHYYNVANTILSGDVCPAVVSTSRTYSQNLVRPRGERF